MSKITCITVISCICIIFYDSTSAAVPTPDPQIVKDFESLLHKYNMTFHGDEYQYRLRAFEHKYREEHKDINSVGDAMEWGVEKLTGMTPNEIKEKYLGGLVINSTGVYTSTHRPSSASLTEYSYSAILLPLALCSIIVNTL
uniref:Uncharacterized protein n=1 Tax=Panagrolaimus sp. ES5 TaxID=591445 RepID=A0AC34FY02_9BILA